MQSSLEFPTSYSYILHRIKQVDPIAYGRSRNHLNGAVSYLSPYISRGVINTRSVFQSLVNRGFSRFQMEKFVQELAWRDYWQQQWRVHRYTIDGDLKTSQPLAERVGMPANIIHHQTGIEAIDKGIEQFYQSGYLHNHLRMYIASVNCNIARCGWITGARWMYYHLLDADWASNALSWQWVCGANSSKLYYANQHNINTYCNTNQHNTYLDQTYEQLPEMPVPPALQEVTVPPLRTPLPNTPNPIISPDADTLIYNFYNLDPEWRLQQPANRILLLEPSVFERYPVSGKSLDFCIRLAKENIPGIQVWVAEFADLRKLVNGTIYYKEHPLNNYKGVEDARTWLTSVTGDDRSFFAFWKKCSKELL